MSDDILYDLRHKQRLQEPRDMHKEPLWGRAADEIERLQGLVAKGLAVVHDFLPNIGRCVLQDYQRMNEFCA